MGRRALVISHGVDSSHDRAAAWMEPCRDFMLRRGISDVRLFYWGDVLFPIVGLPIIGPWVTRSLVRKVQKFCKGLRRELGADVEIDGLFHSFSTRMWWLSMQQDSRYPKTFWRKVVLMGSVVSARVDFGDVVGHFLGLLNLRSMKDEVVAINPFGQSGQEGFLRPDTAKPASVDQVDMTPYQHSSYINPPLAGSTGGAWDRAAAFLSGP